MYKEASDEFKGKTTPEEGYSSLGTNIGSVLTELLKEKNVKRLAQEVGIPRTEIYHILSGRKKYPGLEVLRKLVSALGMDLPRLLAIAEAKRNDNVYFGEANPDFTAQFKKEGVLISSDIPPNKDLFVGKLVLEPTAELTDRLTGDCLIFLRPTKGTIDVTIAEQKQIVNVNQKLFFNGKLTHRIKNPSPMNNATSLFVTTPSFWSLSLTR